jgi:Ca-activated chloride channel family protein
MDANKLPLVRASLAMLVPNLTDKDRVAIVVYAGNTGLVLPSTSGGDTSTILEAIGRLQAGGSTNGGAGLVLAYKVAREHLIKGGVNRVVLATDGDFNVGVTDQGSLLRLIEENRESGVALSVLGYGMGNVKDSTMVKLADAGNGNYAYIDSLAEAQKVLVEQAGGTLVTVAKDVKLQIEFNPRVVSAYRLIGYEKRILQDQDFNNDKKDAGDMGAGHSVTALYELIPSGQPIDVPSIDPLKYQRAGGLSVDAERGEAMTVKIRYKQPDGATSSVLAVAVPEKTTDNPELDFAAAVAEFGMLLRDSEHKGSSSFSNALKLAQKSKGDDPYGHRTEFIRLISAAEGISRLQTARR